MDSVNTDGNFECACFACAGLERLGMADRIGERIDTATMLPAVCQGALALEVREGSEWAVVHHGHFLSASFGVFAG